MTRAWRYLDRVCAAALQYNALAFGARYSEWVRSCSLIVCLILLLTFGSAWPTLEIWPATVFVSLAALLSPPSGLALCVFLAVIQAFIHILPPEIHTLQGISWTVLAARMALRLRPVQLWTVVHSSTGSILLAFTTLVILHAAFPLTSQAYWMAITFSIVLFLITASLVCIDDIEPYRSALILATTSACVFTIIFDAVLVYLPLPALAHPSLLSLPPDQLRLAGLHPNPNATAKFIILTQCFLAAAAVHKTDRPALRKFVWVAVGISSLAVAATGSKSVIGALLAGLGGFILMSLPRRSDSQFVTRLLIVLVVFVVAIVTWGAVFGPFVKGHAGRAWIEHLGERTKRPDLQALAWPAREVELNSASRAADAEGGFMSRVGKEFRIGQSFKLEAEVDVEDLGNPFKSKVSAETATPRTCLIWCTGQRDLLLRAGFDVIRDHWLIGVGFGGWKKELQSRLGYPFDSPHSGFIEAWGEFGVIGAILYLWLAVMIARRAVSTVSRNMSGTVAALGLSYWLLTILFTEIFDVGKFLAMSPHAIWIWPLLALQERELTMKSRRSLS